jgi:defect-in-organelle-trafficking protein DotC
VRHRFTVVLGAVLGAWAAAAPVPARAAQEAQSPALQQLLSASPVEGSAAGQISYVRQQALKMAADVLGAQIGYADRSAQIESILRADAARLDATYLFNALMMGVGVLPPVIVETRDNIALDERVMRVADRTYQIVRAPRFVAIPPTWRNYLFLGLSTDRPEIPTDAAQLPQNDVERAYWKAQVKQAYAQGVKQANSVFRSDLARLKRDYSGMRLFYDLYARGMVTAPVIASTSDVVRRDGPGVISMGDTTFRITVQPSFVTKPAKWNPIAPLDKSPANAE